MRQVSALERVSLSGGRTRSAERVLLSECAYYVARMCAGAAEPAILGWQACARY